MKKIDGLLASVVGLGAAAALVSTSNAGVVAPPCDATIEINAFRGGSPTVGVPGTKNITSKARIAKGTGPGDQTLNNTTLTIEAFEGATLVDSQTSPDNLTLVVGKGGQGDKLTLTVGAGDCTSGSIDFFSRFTGTSSTNGSSCTTTSSALNKICKF